MLTPGDLVYSTANDKTVRYKVVSVNGKTATIETMGREKMQISNVRLDILVAVGKSYQCAGCSKKMSQPQMFEDRPYCTVCIKKIQKCVLCETKAPAEKLTFNYNSSSVYVCNSCVTTQLVTCTSCRHTFTRDRAVLVSNQNYCSLCGDLANHRSFRGARKPYNYVPSSFEFKGEEKTGLYLGIELECANIEHLRHNDVVCGTLEKESKGFYYGVFDSSINANSPRNARNGDGVEVVSHPASLSWWKKHKEYVDLALKLREWGFRSYNAKQCGMHVHLTRSSFTPSSLANFLNLFYEHPDFWTWLSEKPKSVINAYASFNLSASSREAVAKHGATTPDKYFVVRATRHTIELRPFIGALDEVYFYKTLELAHAAYSYARTSGGMTPKGFILFVYKRPKKYSNLVQFLNQRLKTTEWETLLPKLDSIPPPIQLHPCA